MGDICLFLQFYSRMQIQPRPASIARTGSVISVSLCRRFVAMASMAPLRVLLFALAFVVVVTGQTTLQPSPNGCSDRPPGQTGWTCGNRGCTCRELQNAGLCNHETHSTGTMRVCCLTCNGPYPGVRVASPTLPRCKWHSRVVLDLCPHPRFLTRT